MARGPRLALNAREPFAGTQLDGPSHAAKLQHPTAGANRAADWERKDGAPTLQQRQCLKFEESHGKPQRRRSSNALQNLEVHKVPSNSHRRCYRFLRPAELTLFDDVCDEPSDDDLLSERYEILEFLGSGTVGTVRRGIRKADGAEVALKMVRCKDPEKLQTARAEFELLANLPQHTNVIKALAFEAYAEQAVLVLEYFEGLTLNRAVKGAVQGFLPELTAHNFTLCLFRAVAHLHEHCILHRDIKPDNILVSDGGDLRLVDFNVARCLEDGPSLTPTGTLLYQAPEVLSGQPSSEASDVWASGMCLFFMLTGQLPQGRDQVEHSRAQVRRVASDNEELQGTKWQEVSEACKAVVRSSLVMEQRFRPSMTELLSQDWLSPRYWNSMLPSPDWLCSVFEV